MSATWQQTLKNLRPRFVTAGEKHPELRCAMAQAVDTLASPDEKTKYAWHEGRETAEKLLEMARWFHLKGLKYAATP